MEMLDIISTEVPVAVSSVLDTATLPQTSSQNFQRNQTDNAAVRLNLSQAAQDLLSNSYDVFAKPVSASARQESSPSEDSEQQSRDMEEESKGSFKS